MNFRAANLALLVAFMSTSCVYRFTNLVAKPPKGVKTIAVESVYDTSREVLPHDVVWEEMQRAVAANGKMILTSMDEADAVIRIHITTADIAPSGDVDRNVANANYPKLETNPKPSQVRDLTTAGSITNKKLITIQAVYEVFNLETKEKIKSGRFSSALDFLSARPSSNNYLIIEESIASRLRTIAAQLSTRIVDDLIL